MMDTEKIRDTITRLRQAPEQRETILHYLGNRTPQEIRTIIGRKRNYYHAMEEVKELFRDDLDRESWALILAAADYRQNRPHSARVLAEIAREREERKERNRYRGLTVVQKIRRDFDEIETYYRFGMKWTEIRSKLKQKSAYKKEPLHVDTLRHAFKMIEKEMKL